MDRNKLKDVLLQQFVHNLLLLRYTDGSSSAASSFRVLTTYSQTEKNKNKTIKFLTKRTILFLLKTAKQQLTPSSDEDHDVHESF